MLCTNLVLDMIISLLLSRTLRSSRLCARIANVPTHTPVHETTASVIRRWGCSSGLFCSSATRYLKRTPSTISTRQLFAASTAACVGTTVSVGGVRNSPGLVSTPLIAARRTVQSESLGSNQCTSCTSVEPFSLLRFDALHLRRD
jgi:hypothetical protein